MNTNDQAPIHSARRDWLAALMLRHHAPFVSRFAAGVARLRALPRGFRRRLQRKAAAAAVGAALVLGLAGGAFITPTAHAANIAVDGVNCTLVDAIIAANTDTATGGCIAGDAGLDTIDLQADVVLTTAYDLYYSSDTGLPMVTSAIVIEGNGHTIERDDGADEFRIMAVYTTGDLTLNNVTISGGATASVTNPYPNGGGVYVYGGYLTVTDSTFTDNNADNFGGAILSKGGTVTITDSLFDQNDVDDEGGAIGHVGGTMDILGSTFTGNTASDDGGAIALFYGVMTITDSYFSENEAAVGGAIYNDHDLTIVNSTITGNIAYELGGGVYNYGTILRIIGSTISNNAADDYGGGISSSGNLEVTNSTISGNRSHDGGGIDNQHRMTITNSTLSDNKADDDGGGIHNSYGSYAYLSRNLISGNRADGYGDEVYNQSIAGNITAGDYNVFSHAGLTSAEAFANFAPGTSDFNASSDASNVALAAILDTTLGSNGGTTETHNLVPGSPALDTAPDADCAADPTSGVDQRGGARPFDMLGMGNEVTDTCDAGAVEFGTPVSANFAIFMSAKKSGTTADGVDFDNSDILKWDGIEWSKVFDGTDAHLDPVNKPKHNINAFFYDDDDIIMSFAQNGRKVFGIDPKVDGTDLVHWDGSVFSLWFDGSDVGLTKKTPEKIDALHVQPGDTAPSFFNGACEQYLLISTQGAGAVPAYGGGQIKFSGEDILGFCLTNWGEATDGFWHMVFDGSDVGLPKNSLDSISVSADDRPWGCPRTASTPSASAPTTASSTSRRARRSTSAAPAAAIRWSSPMTATPSSARCSSPPTMAWGNLRGHQRTPVRRPLRFQGR